MRLDHLLSKEIIGNGSQGGLVDGIFSEGQARLRLKLDSPLFNLRGMPRKEQKRVKSSVGSEHGGVAQLGEHLPCKQGVKSSNLSISIRSET